MAADGETKSFVIQFMRRRYVCVHVHKIVEPLAGCFEFINEFLHIVECLQIQLHVLDLIVARFVDDHSPYLFAINWIGTRYDYLEAVAG